MAGPVEMRAEISPVFGDDAPMGQAEDLIPAAVREDRPLPADEQMKASTTCDEFISRTQQQVIRVREHDLSTRVFEVRVPDGLDRSLGADRHEGRCLKDAVRRPTFAETCSAIGRSHAEAELAHVKMIRVKKLRVGVIYGGRSGEHEVSVASAASIFRHLDRERYEAVPIRIEKSGQWVLGGRVPEMLSAADVVEQRRD